MPTKPLTKEQVERINARMQKLFGALARREGIIIAGAFTFIKAEASPISHVDESYGGTHFLQGEPITSQRAAFTVLKLQERSSTLAISVAQQIDHARLLDGLSLQSTVQ